MRRAPATQDAARVVPENEKSYPEPSMFGVLPAYGFYVRHAKGITFDNVKVTFDKPEERPAFVLDDVKDIDLFRIDAQPTSAFFVLKNVENFSVQHSKNIKDQRIERVEPGVHEPRHRCGRQQHHQRHLSHPHHRTPDGHDNPPTGRDGRRGAAHVVYLASRRGRSQPQPPAPAAAPSANSRPPASGSSGASARIA